MTHLLGQGVHVPILLIIGGAVFAGGVGARIFQWLRIPQVVGYIAIGLLLGKPGLGVINDEQIRALMPFNFFALGVIGFNIGGELHRKVFQQYGVQFIKILLSEGMTAFLFTSVLVTGAAYGVAGDLSEAAALGIVLGAIASATAPAATVDVLWEYKTRGILTTTVLAIVALDDGLALLLYSLASSVAMRLMGENTIAWGGGMLHTLYELGGALLLGGFAGALLSFLLRRIRDHEKMLTFIIGMLTLVLGVALLAELDVILAAMTLGMTLVNLSPHRSREAFQIVERFSPPIYVLFFVFVGARLSVRGMSAWMWGMAAAYVAGRTAGKMLGAYAGARWARAADVVRKYLGLCLFSQAGVAIGLAILAGIRFHPYAFGGMTMGDAIVLIVTATTFLVQIIGPPCVKLAVTKAEEVGLDVTEEDLVQTYIVRDAMSRAAPTFDVRTPVLDVLRGAAQSDAMSFPVLDDHQRLAGIITMEDLKKCLLDLDMGAWLVAFDIMRPAPDAVGEDAPLADALEQMTQIGVDYLPVVTSGEEKRYVGMLERQAVNRMISLEVVRRRQQAEES